MSGGIQRTEVDPFTEVMFCKDSDAYPFTDFTQLQFRGPVDQAAMAAAWDEALRLVPLFSAHLSIERHGLLQLPVWLTDPEAENPLRFDDCRDRAPEPFEPMAFSMGYHRARMDRRLDLTREYPFQGFWLRVGEDRHILSVIYQHSVVDPNKAYRVLTRLLALYHEKTTGRPPDWAASVGMASLAGRREATWNPPAHTPLTFPWEVFRHTARMLGWEPGQGPIRPAMLASEELRDPASEPGRHGLRAVIDDWKLIEALLERAKRNRATLNDLLLAVALRLSTGWNRERATDRRAFRLALATSLKGRTALPEHTGTGLSALTFIARGDDGSDLDATIAFFRDYRRSALAAHLDVKAWSWASSWYALLRVLPFEVRMQHLARWLTAARIGFNLSNVGVVWPRIIDGRATRDSVLLGAGDLTIEDMHSCPTFGPNTCLGLVTRMHNRRFYLNFVCDRFRFRESEARQLRDDFMSELVAAA